MSIHSTMHVFSLCKIMNATLPPVDATELHRRSIFLFTSGALYCLTILAQAFVMGAPLFRLRPQKLATVGMKS